MYVVGPKELLLDDHIVPKVPISLLVRYGSFFFPGAPLYNRYRYFGSTQPKEKKTSHHAKLATIFSFLAKFLWWV